MTRNHGVEVRQRRHNMTKVKDLDIHLDSDSELAHKAAEHARDLVDAYRLGGSTFMLVVDDFLQAFNRGTEEGRLEGLAYLSACLCAMTVRAGEVGDELAAREDFTLAETLRQCRETDFTF